MKSAFYLFPLYLLLGCATSSTSEDLSKPNILLLFTDDQTYRSLRILGNEEIQTPHLDRLASRGTTFTHAYNQGGWHGAVCVASRSMMVSGLSIWQAQAQEELWRNKDPEAMRTTWGQLMTAQGYRTYMTGKWHVAAPADEVFTDARHIRPGMPGDRRGELGKARPNVLRALESGEDINELMPVGYNRPLSPEDDSWLPTDSAHGGFWEGGIHWSEVVKNDALDFLTDAAGYTDPFFMYVAFNAPHDPRQAPQEFIDMYPVDDVDVPENFLPLYPWMDEIGCDRFLRDEALAPFPRTPYAIRKHRQEYYAIISHLDTQVGHILDKLEDSGKSENTYIFFTSDHGLSVGQHGLVGKQNMYDHSMRVPLIVAGPDIPAGTTNDEFVYLQDVMASALDLADTEKPEQLYFSSLIDLAKGSQSTSTYQAIYGAYRDRQRMVRDRTHKLIMYPEAQVYRLFNLQDDPMEMRDLAEDPKHAEICKDLFSKFQQLQSELQDTLELGSVFPELL